MSEAQRIAAELTEAQREHLLHAPFAIVAADGRTCRALERKALLDRKGTVPNRHMPAWPLPAMSPTPLGLEVRKILEAQS